MVLWCLQGVQKGKLAKVLETFVDLSNLIIITKKVLQPTEQHFKWKNTWKKLIALYKFFICYDKILCYKFQLQKYACSLERTAHHYS